MEWPSFETDALFEGLGFSSGAVAIIRNVVNAPMVDPLESEKGDAVARALQLSDEDLQNNPILQSYRDFVARIGRSAKRFPPSAYALHQSVRRTGRLPQISAIVDSYNLEALNSFLSFGVHDLDLLKPPITFRASKGGEPFQAVGSPDIKETQAGDYVYADTARVLAWLDSKDSEQVKVSFGTSNLLLIVQGTSVTPSELTQNALESACQRIVRYCGGSFELRPLWK